MKDIEAMAEARAIAIYEAANDDTNSRTPWTHLPPGEWDKWRRAANVAQQVAVPQPAKVIKPLTARQQFTRDRLQRQVDTANSRTAASMKPKNDEVICPGCQTQFRAIPVNVQRLMLDVGFEPPFVAAPQPAYVPLSDEDKMILVTNWFCDEWAVKNAMELLDDYDGVIEQAVRGKT